MENFSLSGTDTPDHSPDRTDLDKGSLEMSVSSVVGEGKGKKIYVQFKDAGRSCEGVYPDCKVTDSVGFSEEEVSQLELFMMENSKTIKDMARTVSVWKAFSGK